MTRLSTKATMVDALTALDDRARYHADFVAGFAAAMKSGGLSNDHIHAALHHDRGEWLIDRDGRQVWRPAL